MSLPGEKKENTTGRKKPVLVFDLPRLLVNSSGLHPDQFMPEHESHLSAAARPAPVASYFISDD